MQRRRPVALMGATLLALVLAAQPATAYKELKNSGPWAYPDGPTVTDEAAAPGVTCVYENNPGTSGDELDKIRIRQLWTHHPIEAPAKAYVGFRLQITRNTKPFADNKYVPYQATPLIKKRANDEEVAFFKATWKAPEGSRARYRVVVKLFYYTPGSTSNVGGVIRGRMEAYRHKLRMSSSSYVVGDVDSPGFCGPKFIPSILAARRAAEAERPLRARSAPCRPGTGDSCHNRDSRPALPPPATTRRAHS